MKDETVIKTKTETNYLEVFRCIVDDVLRVLWLIVLIGWVIHGWNL